MTSSNDLSSYGPNHAPSILIIGKRGSGKTNLINETFLKNRNVVVFSKPMERSGDHSFYKSKGLEVHEDTKILRLLMRDQLDSVKNIQYKDIDTNLTIIFDGFPIISLKQIDGLKELLINGRHYNITVIISLQYLPVIDVEYRANIDKIILFKTSSISIDRIHSYFSDKTLEEFTNEFQNLKTYEYLVIDNK